MKLVFLTTLFTFWTPLMAKQIGDLCYDKYYEGDCLKKRNVEDIVPCLRVNFNRLPKFCDPYRKLIEQSLRRIDPIDAEEIRRCETILLKGCFNTRSTTKIVRCMEENLRNFSPGCEEFKIKASGNIPQIYRENKRIRRHVIKCTRNLTRNCGNLVENYKKFRQCISSKLKPECSDLFVIQEFKIKKIYDEFEIENMKYKCELEKKDLCPESLANKKEECIEKINLKHSKECISFFRESK